MFVNEFPHLDSHSKESDIYLKNSLISHLEEGHSEIKHLIYFTSYSIISRLNDKTSSQRSINTSYGILNFQSSDYFHPRLPSEVWEPPYKWLMWFILH